MTHPDTADAMREALVAADGLLDALRIFEENDVRLKIRAALSAARTDRDGWQPIESAPKDQSIIAWADGTMGEAYYDGEDDSWWWANISRFDYVGHAIYPTLWQPLPSAPAAPEGQGK